MQTKKEKLFLLYVGNNLVIRNNFRLLVALIFVLYILLSEKIVFKNKSDT
jgi:hypothetical protein